MVGLLKTIEKLIKWAIFLSFAVMIIAVVVQVVARTFMPQPPIWTEEVSRMTLLYVLSLGVGASVVTGDLVNVDLALMLMSKSARRVCELISAALVSLFGFILIPGSWEFSELGSTQTSPVLDIAMTYSFITMPIFAALLGIFGLLKFITLWKNVPETEFAAHAPIGE